MAAEKGRNFLLKVTDGVSPVVFTTLAGLKTTGMTIGNTQVDITTKDSAGWRELLGDAGDRTVSISATGVFKDSASEDLVRGYALTGTIDQYQIAMESGDDFTGGFQVASLEFTGEHNGAREYSITLESDGVIAFTSA